MESPVSEEELGNFSEVTEEKECTLLSELCVRNENTGCVVRGKQSASVANCFL